MGAVYADGIARFILGGVAVVCARRCRRGVLCTVRQFIWLEAFHRNAAGSLRPVASASSDKKTYKT